jgi:tripartite-type tricarboxylate transporter receptor subunit TctC
LASLSSSKTGKEPTAVAKSPPDGYTLLGANLGILGINPAVYDKLLYDPAKELVPISRIAISQLLLIAGKDVGFDSVAGLVDKAKKEPGKLTYASSGNGSASHLAGVLFNELAGVDIVHVPYRGASGAATDVAGGTISINFGGQGAAWSLVDAGKVRALASTGDKRLKDHADTPTVTETVRGYFIVDWTGLLAPAGTPQPVINKLTEAVGKAFSDPDVAKRFAAQGLEPAAGTPEEFSRFIKEEQNKWAAVARKANVRVEQ